MCVKSFLHGVTDDSSEDIVPPFATDQVSVASYAFFGVKAQSFQKHHNMLMFSYRQDMVSPQPWLPDDPDLTFDRRDQQTRVMMLAMTGKR